MCPPRGRRESQRKRESEKSDGRADEGKIEGVTLDPWPLHLRGCSRLGGGKGREDGDHGPFPQETAAPPAVDHDRATVPQACSLHPGTGSETPSPGHRQWRTPLPGPANAGRDLRCLPCACVSLSLSATPPTLLPVSSVQVSFPTATAHGAENVTRLQLGKFRPPGCVWVAWRCCDRPTVLVGGGEVKSCLNHACHAAPAQPNLRDKVSTTDKRSLARLPHVFGVSNVIFNIFFFYSPSSLWLHASHGGNQTCVS